MSIGYCHTIAAFRQVAYSLRCPVCSPRCCRIGIPSIGVCRSRRCSLCSATRCYRCFTYRLSVTSFSYISRIYRCSKKCRLGNYNILSYRTIIAIAYIYIIGIAGFFTIGRNRECMRFVVGARRILRSSAVIGAEYIVVRLCSRTVGVRIAGTCGSSVVGYSNLYRTGSFTIAVHILLGNRDCRVGLFLNYYAVGCRTTCVVGNSNTVSSCSKFIYCSSCFRIVPQVCVWRVGACTRISSLTKCGCHTYVIVFASGVVGSYRYSKFGTDCYSAFD